MDLSRIYGHRFSARDVAEMRVVWNELVRGFFQRFVKPDAQILDLGAGYCHLVNAVSAARRIAFDANPDIRRHADDGVEVIISDDLTLPMIPDGSLDHVFMSNFLEHLPSSEVVLAVLRTVRRKLRPDGSVLVLQPNFKYVGASYFDFIDHHVVLTDGSLGEALELAGFSVTYMKKRFLPYTSKSRLPRTRFLVRLYLWLTPLHRLFGQQTFVEARPRVSAD